MRLKWRFAILIQAFLTVLPLLLLSLIIPLNGFWVVDSALKWWQILSLVESWNFQQFNVKYSLLDLDPYYRFVPLQQFQYFIHEGQLFLQWPPGFAYLAGIFYGLGGVAATRLLTLGSAVAVGAGATRIAREFGCKRSWMAGAVTIFATPVLPYAFIVWEMLPTLALATWSLAVLLPTLRGRPQFLRGVYAGVLGGCAIALREEYAVWCVSLAAALLVCRLWRALTGHLIATATVVICIVCFNTITTESPLFATRWTSMAIDKFQWSWQSRPGVMHKLLSWASGNDLLDSVLLFAAAAVIAAPFIKNVSLRFATMACSLAAILAARWYSYNFTAPVSTQVHVNSLLVSSPIAFLGAMWFVDGKYSRVASARLFAFTAIVAFSLLTLLLCPTISAIGKHFGPRMLLPIYPVLAASGLIYVQGWRERNYAGAKWLTWFAAATLVIAICDSGVSMYRLRLAVRTNAQLIAAIKAQKGLPILCGPRSMSQIASLNYGHKLISIREPGKLPEAVALAKQVHPKHALLVTGVPIPKTIADHGKVKLLPAYEAIRSPDPTDWVKVYEVEWK